MKTLQQLMDLSGRVAVVTGGAGHIGRALCEALAELGAAVVVLDQQADTCQQVAHHLRATYQVETLELVLDLADQEQVQSVAKRVLNRLGRLDILVHCAAFVGTSALPGWVSPFAQQRSDVFRDTLDLNLTAPFILTQSCADALEQSGHGSVIHIGSIYGLVGPDMRLYQETALGNPAAYAASKGGLLQLTRWLATVLAPAVRVNAITPGGIWRNQPAAFIERYVERTPLRRMGNEEELKGAVAYLASDLSAYVTGQNLIVDGGWTSW